MTENRSDEAEVSQDSASAQKSPQSSPSFWSKFSGKGNAWIAIAATLALHLILLVILGGLVVWRTFAPSGPAFEGIVTAEQAEKKKRHKVIVQQAQKQSNPSQKRITVQAPSSISIPNVELKVPDAKVRVSVSIGTAGGLGLGLGGGGAFSGAVNFLGVESKGERIVLIIDFSGSMESKAGPGSFALVREEAKNLIESLSPGTLVNVIFMNHGIFYYSFSPKLVVASDKTKQAIKKWIHPVNNQSVKGGKPRHNIDIERKGIGPLKAQYVKGWFRALQIAYEQGADSIYILVDHWSTDVHQDIRKEPHRIISHLAEVRDTIYNNRNYKPSVNVILFQNAHDAPYNAENFKRLTNDNKGKFRAIDGVAELKKLMSKKGN